MKCGVIDIGSNSMRLSVYQVQDQKFETIFKEKLMSGLANYVEDGLLTEAGIHRACSDLDAFQSILRALEISDISVIATASLRNVSNANEAAKAIQERTGLELEVITGYNEALYGYRGAMYELSEQDGMFVDIGGASTEIVSFKSGDILSANSYPVGSLKLYRDCVRRILPGKKSLTRIEERINGELERMRVENPVSGKTLVCVGGTARASLSLSHALEAQESGENRLTLQSLQSIKKFLMRGDDAAIDLILKNVPDRVHTIVPGICLLAGIAEAFRMSEIAVSRYGVREGYLCQKLHKMK